MMSRWWPDRIGAQMAVVMIVAMVIMQVVMSLIFLALRENREHTIDHPGQIVMLAQLVDAAPSDRRAALVADIAYLFPRLAAQLVSPATAAAIHWHAPPPPPDAENGPWRGLTVAFDVEERAPGGPRMAIRLGDGAALLVNEPRRPLLPFGPPFQALLAIALAAVLLTLWAMWALTKPLRALERQALGFTLDGDSESLAVRGPREIRAATDALNRMQSRIRTLIKDRTQMLAALSHDLRTPLTRLRLRMEFVGDEALKAAMLNDAAQIQEMADSALVFLRDGGGRRAFVTLDIASALHGICHDFADIGHDVAYEGPDHLILDGDPEGLTRAFTNLIDNGVRYGGRTRVRVAATAGRARIDIADAGPGIADERKEAMLQPFVRGDNARHMDASSGFGLGLPIARAAILRHGGTLDLVNEGPGFTVRVTLPAKAAAP